MPVATARGPTGSAPWEPAARSRSLKGRPARVPSAGRHIGSPSRHAGMRQMCFEDVEPAVPAQHGTEPAATAGTQFAMSKGS